MSVLHGGPAFHPSNNGQWPPTSKDFYPRFYFLHSFFLS